MPVSDREWLLDLEEARANASILVWRTVLVVGWGAVLARYLPILFG